MRPEISHLLKIHEEFYPDLQDHDSVKAYDHVRGVDKDVFFLNHNVAEKVEQDGRSRSNEFEAEFLTGLCRYLLQQEYRPDQITILTAYTGQLWCFRNLMPKSVFGSVKVCPVDRYQETTEVQAAKDFMAVPEGGCKKPCETRLDCGHVCPMICHPRDSAHFNIMCKKQCTKTICDLHHECSRLCYQPCDTDCNFKINKLLECGHTKEIHCHEGSSHNIQCLEKCQILLRCGHHCKRNCSEECTDVCKEKVVKQFKCGHKGKAECGNMDDNCPELCDNTLLCGHKCGGTCGACKHGRLHVPCVQPCKRTLVCGHECKSSCTEYCPPCVKHCENRCKHSKCVRKCGQSCTPCQEVCEWSCAHSECRRPCGESCVRLPCDEPCRKLLPCKHECIGVCGETCPKLCRICNKDEVTEVLFGNEDKYDARFVLLEDCDHIIEVVALDTWMEQTTVDEDTTVQLCVCPNCKTPIRRNLRYGNIIKQVRADVEEIKKQVRGDPVNIRREKRRTIQDLSLEGMEQLENSPYCISSSKSSVCQMSFTCSVLRAFVNNFQSQIKQCWTETQMTSLSYKMDMFKKLCEQKRKTTRIEDRKGNLERKQTLDRIFKTFLSGLISCRTLVIRMRKTGIENQSVYPIASS
ncbi:putative NFX1-type zinc finger-containing protein 1 [Apostichopus japonicus]|uniref:Putative NFX1-type zinc finger-containing protein 1 n=1 Tax=Stichopus japonicus TaxID=307972 RepID=A0A2G8LS32_STIJA|nr:putative NFX1-type zinc finger-containing protein 1 [Apostichopus japonicus]